MSFSETGIYVLERLKGSGCWIRRFDSCFIQSSIIALRDPLRVYMVGDVVGAIEGENG